MSSSITEAKLSRVYFPLTGDPVGHHHLLLAESVLQQLPEIQLVIFIISNGIHPDPLKNRKITTAALRLEILKSALNTRQRIASAISNSVYANFGRVSGLVAKR